MCAHHIYFSWFHVRQTDLYLSDLHTIEFLMTIHLDICFLLFRDPSNQVWFGLGKSIRLDLNFESIFPNIGSLLHEYNVSEATLLCSVACFPLEIL